MAKPKKALDHTAECSPKVGVAGLSIPVSAPQSAMAVWGTYKDFRHLVAYVLTDEAGLAIETVKQQGYFGLEWEAELVTLLPPSP
jgi:hypothetical protein